LENRLKPFGKAEEKQRTIKKRKKW
jgi:hypothetical protein